MYVIKIKKTGRIIAGFFEPINTKKEAERIAALSRIYWNTMPGYELGEKPELIVEEVA